jgi:hypothetical protein
MHWGRDSVEGVFNRQITGRNHVPDDVSNFDETNIGLKACPGFCSVEDAIWD